MALQSRTNIYAVIQEDTAGTLKDITSGDQFVPAREGSALSNELETVATDQLKSGIGASAPINVGENPTASVPLYNKHSGVEGQEPEYGIMVESALGDKTVNATEYDTVGGSTTTVINVDTGEGVNFEEGQALLIKDATNGYSVRNIDSISSDALTLNFELSSAPASGVDLGKAVVYKPAASGHPTYSLHNWQAETNPGFYQAIAGCRTNSLTFEFPTKDLAALTTELEGTKYYYNGIRIDATSNIIDFDDSVGNVTGTVEQKVYTTPIELADEIASKMTAASVGSGNDTITCTYSSSTGKYTIASGGTTLELNCTAANNVYSEIGFGTSDLTGALTYTAASTIATTITSPFSPSYDSSDQIVIRNSELFIGDQDSITCRKATNQTLTIGTPVTDVTSICAENGVSESLILSREVTYSATLVLDQYQVEVFDRAINNTTTKFMCNIGPKTADNWDAGKTFNFYSPTAKINAVPIADQDGYQVINLEATMFLGDGDIKEIYLNYL